MADNLCLGLLLFLCVLWPIISSASSNEACLYDEDVATATGRNCTTNRPCSIENDICKGSRECLCDGACGYRCISTRKTSYCKELPPPLNGFVEYSTGNQAFGSRASYDCDTGYLLSSEGTERTCLGDGEWSIGETPQCLPQDEVCPRLASVNRTCYQACNVRLDCENKQQESCLCDGDCGMSCRPVYVSGYCPEVELSRGAVVVSMTTKRIVYTSVVTLGCEDRFEVEEGSEEITCLIDGTWSGQPLRCRRKAACEDPPEIEGVRHDSWEAYFYPGDELFYTCRPGYHGYGLGEKSSCLEDLSWTPVSLDCYPISCGDPGYLSNGWREGNLFTFLSRVTFHCNAGYEMQGYPYRTCMSNQRWTSFLPTCVAIECPELYAPEHGSIQGRRFTYNSQVYLDCEEGYKLSGSEQRRCQGNKTWSGEETICRVITCPEPEAPLHGSKISPRYNLDAIVRFSCNQGYTLIGSRTARCTEEETWSQPTPECQADCIVLSPPEHGYYASSRFRRYTANEVVEHGTVIEIVCSRWHSLNSDEEYTCTNGQWSFDAKCVATPCSKLPELLNGQIVYNPELVDQSLPTVPHDTRATYTCLYGFELQERHNAPQCYYGTWLYKTSEPVCSPKLCSQDNLEHGSIRYTKNNEEFSVRKQDPHHGVSRTFQCSRGYSLVSAQTEASVCVDGVWNTTVPACGPDACSRPAVAGSNVEVQSLGHGGTAHVTCDQGLKPSVGNGGLRCHAGHWVPEGIMCISSDAPSNVAYGRPASQSPRSDESDRQLASLAVDGDRTTDSEHGSCTTARKSGRQVFWEVDLQATYRIEYVDIYSKRKPKLKGATVRVGYPDATRESYSQCGLTISDQMVEVRQPSVRVDCNDELIAGQIIRIELQESDKLSLCEVEVFATGPIATCKIPHIAGMRQARKGDGGVLLTNAQVPSGTGIAYNCQTGYQRNGAVDNLCRGKGTWARQLPTCDADDCEVQDPENGELDQRIRSIRHNSELAYSCNNGYEKENKVTRCELGVLTPGPPKCVHQRCSLLASDFSNVMINNQELEPDAEGKVYIPHDTHVYFSCTRGYELMNSNVPLCWMGNLRYFEQLPSCRAVRCRDPYLMHGSYRLIQGDRYEHGSAIRYECNPGYTLQDPAAESAYCDDGRWSLEPVCHPDDQVTEPPVAAATCPTPSVPNALIYHRGQNIATTDFEIIFVNGHEIEIRCNTDFTVNGMEVVTATCRNGAWRPALPRCEVAYKRSCSRPVAVPDVRQYVDDSIKLPDSPRTSFFHKSTIMSRCQDPLTMTLVTGPLRTCNDGRWTGPVPVCERASTSFSLPALRTTLHQFMANGTLLIYPGVGQLNVDCIVSGGYPVLESHSQQWTPGGRGKKKYGVPAEGHSGTYTCKKAGLQSVFHRLMIQVRAVSCSEPRPPLNGRRIGDDFRLTKSVSFECNEGFDLIGEGTIKCNLGEWLGEKPRCSARDCPEINMAHLDPNLRLTINGGNSPGSVVIFTCQSGFHRVGETRLTCQGGSWSPPFPTCEADVPDDTGPLLRPDDCNCEVWERCVANSNGPSTCHCIHPRQCDDAVGQEQYCGSDGRTYTSICRMKAAGCLLDLDIQFVSNGPCPETTGDPNQPDEDTLYSDYASESSESSMDSALSPIPTDGEDMPTAADRSVEGTTQGSSTSIQYCETCVALNLGTACQNSTHVFVGIPQKVEPAQPDSLNYSVNVVTTIKGYTHTQDITFLMQGTLDETNQCYCPRVTVGHDEYLFILREDSSASFPIINGFVGLWADHSATYDSTCNL